MYESLLQLGRDLAPLLKGKDPALFHEAGPKQLLGVHERHAAARAEGHCPEWPPIGPFLMRRIADARTLMQACDDLSRHGGNAPGLNDRRLRSMDRKERWSLCRALA